VGRIEEYRAVLKGLDDWMPYLTAHNRVRRRRTGPGSLGQHPGDRRHVEVLHRFAGDARWRVREGVAMAVQRAGDEDSELAFALAESWAHDPDPLVRRAAVAAICEPRLL